jgi:hypothetical protein
MTHKALIRKLQISCLGLDPIDPLRLLVDDVIAALAQPEQEPAAKYSDIVSDGGLDPRNKFDTPPPQRTWVGLTGDDWKQITRKANYHWEMTTSEYAERIGELTEATLKEKNT